MDTHITLRGMDTNPALDTFIREQTGKLEHFFDGIITCRVAVERPQARRGGPYHVRIDMRVPGEDIVVSRRTSLHAALAHGEVEEETKAEEIDAPHKDVYFAVSQAFRAAGRRLQDYRRRRQGAVKVHETQPEAKVVRLEPDGDFGFLEAADGHEVYFHRNSVLDGSFDRLAVGSSVTFVEESGEKGPQASTVRIVGAAESAKTARAR